ncbi:error-prone DNA polymerase [Rudaea sp.]|uniref:error-prone DNA polymerase n=1 Tax=Rudaea sp. TaxID=2136325 RepID=UPI00321FFFA2
MSAAPDYAELHCLSNFSFQRGASSARELFERAKKLGYRALAITDECSLAGIVRAWEASKATGVALIVGSEILLDDGLKLVLLAPDLAAYQSLCALITQGRRGAKKGAYALRRADVAAHAQGLLALWIPGEMPCVDEAKWIMRHFPQSAWLTVELHRGPDDAARQRRLLDFAARQQLPAVAAGDVHMHVRRRRALQDTLTAIRHRTTLRAGSGHLFANGERHLRRREALAELHPRELLEETLRIAARCAFDLKRDLKYAYPREIVPQGHTPTSWLRHLVEQGARWRWPEGESAAVRAQIAMELALIAKLGYEAFFLTVHDIVGFARGRGILCQGRGSAANSAVCFCLGITEVDPARSQLVFGRFLSEERGEPPDIDVDFEHERREEVIQYVYAKYGRERAALAATVISYRTRSALRDVARALGFSVDQVDQLSRAVSAHDDRETLVAHLTAAGFDPAAPMLRRALALARELHGFPRHLSQHVGGFVICDAPLSTLVPVENAAMPGRTIIQWDKDDLDTMCLLKVDCLALGMLTCLRKCFDLIEPLRGERWTLATLPKEDSATYAMIRKADTIGVFQIESRAQMAMLPRLKPAEFYDLVIQVAIVRPGPIQGDMVHPYLRRRQKKEAVSYPSPEIEEVLERTLGVPLFQEQVMRIAEVAAGFTPGEADELRRSMAAWKRRGGLEHLRERLIGGMLERHYPRDFAERIFEQMKGFGDYGFPESHATSFAMLAYASSWLKCHEPAAFACALLNSQPMGFYSASQIVQDLRRHGAEVLPVDVRYSGWDCSLEEFGTRRLQTTENPQPGLRLGLREIRGFGEGAARRIEAARAQAGFASLADLCTRARLDRREQALLARAGALRGLAGHRHRAHWAVAGVEESLPLFGRDSPAEAQVALPPPGAGETVLADYASTGLTLGPHPLALLRGQLEAQRCWRSSRLRKVRGTRPVRAAGLVIGRQRPQTASGLTFVTLEDEDGAVNVIVRPELAERQRRAFLESRLLAVDGLLESVDGVQHLIAGRLHDLSALLGGLDSRSRDFR